MNTQYQNEKELDRQGAAVIAWAMIAIIGAVVGLIVYSFCKLI